MTLGMSEEDTLRYIHAISWSLIIGIAYKSKCMVFGQTFDWHLSSNLEMSTAEEYNNFYISLSIKYQGSNPPYKSIII